MDKAVEHYGIPGGRSSSLVLQHGACAELWSGTAELLELVDTCVPNFSLLELGAASSEGIAAALERLYADPAYRRKMSLAAYRNATRSVYRWDRISGRWHRLFEGLPRGGEMPSVRGESRICGRR